MVTIEIDGKPYPAQAGQMLIEVAQAHGIDIPRFCYHKKLSISASCRMCLVEIEKAPKPMPACATPVMDGMKVWTRSEKALNAQQSVMEFLLINHPLDCPICDQGGECELQDVAVGYGQDQSRYREGKRVVMDKNLGPLIATEMTRCIHCTRCVRFSQEITGIQELGATGRGEHTLIGTYIEKNVTSELSGNVIDLCPVGALTSKPFRFAARAWELQQCDGIAPHDSVGSNIYLHVRRNQVLRVTPRENEGINEVWISDRDRFSYEGLTAPDRLTVPMIKKEGVWQSTQWEKALAFAVEGLKKVIHSQGAKAVGALASPTATLEEFYLLQKLMRGLGSPHIDHRLRQVDFSDQDQAPLFPYLGQTISELETCHSALVIGSHLRKEQPLLNHRLRKAALQGAKILLINPIDYEFNFPIAHQLISSPGEWVKHLAAVAKALLDNPGTLIPEAMQKLLADVTVTDDHRKMAQLLRSGTQRTVLLGNLVTTHPQFALIRALAATIAKLGETKLGYLGEACNTTGAWLAGMLPHRQAGGVPTDPIGMDAYAMLTQGLKAYVLLGLEPELDSWNGAAALASLQKAEFVVSLSAYRTPVMESYADVILPLASFAETSGTFVNIEGRWQSFTGAVPPPQEARPGWKILRVLGTLLNVEGFGHLSSEEVKKEVQAKIAPFQIDNKTAWQIPSTLTFEIPQKWQRITEMPIYSGDALVRRATALQRTLEAQSVQGIRINPREAAQLNLNEGHQVKVTQGSQRSLPLVIDERVPDQCVLIYAGQSANIDLGPWYGPINLLSTV